MQYDNHTCRNEQETQEELNEMRQMSWEDKMMMLSLYARLAAYGVICKGCLTRVAWGTILTEHEKDPIPVFTNILADMERTFNSPIDEINDLLGE